MTCDSTTGVCPGTELTCTCTTPAPVLTWILPGSVTIEFPGSDGVGSSETGPNGTFFAIVTYVSSEKKESMLRYTATENGVIRARNERTLHH